MIQEEKHLQAIKQEEGKVHFSKKGQVSCEITKEKVVTQTIQYLNRIKIARTNNHRPKILLKLDIIIRTNTVKDKN